ncbi:MAG: hypothetical protein MHPSP_000466 [Paramarteilia canceri]
MKERLNIEEKRRKFRLKFIQSQKTYLQLTEQNEKILNEEIKNSLNENKKLFIEKFRQNNKIEEKKIVKNSKQKLLCSTNPEVRDAIKNINDFVLDNSDRANVEIKKQIIEKKLRSEEEKKSNLLLSLQISKEIESNMKNSQNEIFRKSEEAKTLSKNIVDHNRNLALEKEKEKRDLKEKERKEFHILCKENEKILQEKKQNVINEKNSYFKDLNRQIEMNKSIKKCEKENENFGSENFMSQMFRNQDDLQNKRQSSTIETYKKNKTILNSQMTNSQKMLENSCDGDVFWLQRSKYHEIEDKYRRKLRNNVKKSLEEQIEKKSTEKHIENRQIDGRNNMLTMPSIISEQKNFLKLKQENKEFLDKFRSENRMKKSDEDREQLKHDLKVVMDRKEMQKTVENQIKSIKASKNFI